MSSAADWVRRGRERVCDVVEPWEHGTVYRAARYPNYYDYNLLVVEGDPGLSADELIAAADDALAGLVHRRIDFEVVEAGDRVRPALEAARWEPTRLLWMLHSEPLPPGPAVAVETVDYDVVLPLRLAWHDEDFPDLDSRDYLDNAREVAMTRDVQVLAVVEGGEPVGYAQVERMDGDAEVGAVYVRREHRGRGRGTALTRAAIEAAGDVENLWIAADDEDRPKELYARLGFRPAQTEMEFTRAPGLAGWTGES